MVQSYSGRHQLIKRLTLQVGDKDLAKGILKDRGHMFKNGNLTAAGKQRDAMTARERALDRAAKASGHSKTDFKYDAKSNSTRLK